MRTTTHLTLIICLSSTALFNSTTIYGQINTNPKWELGINAGAFIYQGDLAPSAWGSYKTAKPGLSIYGSRILNASFALRTSLTFASLKGDDLKYGGPAWRQARALNFRTPVYEISETLVWDILGNNYDHYNTRFSPYLFAGIGYSFLHIRRDASKYNSTYFGAESTTTNGLTADLAHRTPAGIPVLPVGIGVRYSLSPAISLTAETSYRLTATDYLDGFSKVANPSKNDHYYSFSIGMVYTFFKSAALKCPKKPL
ncbi:MAG TPA: DUF6089 family protein [Puia sp.]|nr:DUF6089 family protein [Puia sp.]